MTSTSTFLGLDILVEVGMSYIDSYVSTLTDMEAATIRQTFDDYVHERISYDKARQILINIVGRDDALAKIRDIINISDEPIPFHDDKDQDDSQILMRKKTRTWTAVEDQRLLAGVSRYGLDNWQTVAHFLGSGRNRAQCSQRWTRGLNPHISKKSWTPEEDEQLEELVRIHGDKAWTKVAAILGNRSDVQCRYHYRQLSSGDRIPLNRSSNVACSTEGFRWKETPAQMVQPQPQPNHDYMPLRTGRAFASTPMMVNQQQNSGDRPILLPPLMPNDPSRRNRLEYSSTILRPSDYGTNSRWGVTFGADPQELDSFLSHFND